MNVIEFIGFIITFGALIFLGVRRYREMRYLQEHPEEAALEEEKQQRELEALLESLDIDRGILQGKPSSKRKSPPKKPQKLPSQATKPKIPSQPLKKIVPRKFINPYEVSEEEKKELKKSAYRPPPLEEMIVHYEIFKNPKGLE